MATKTKNTEAESKATADDNQETVNAAAEAADAATADDNQETVNAAAEAADAATADDNPADDEAPRTGLEPARCGLCVYLGPTIRAEIVGGTVYDAGKQETLKSLKALVEKYPDIAALIVPGDEVAAARTKIRTPGNYLSELYRKLSVQNQL